MQITNNLLNVTRLPEHQQNYYEIKDPSVLQLKDGSYLMYASIGNSVHQHWKVGRFHAPALDTEWTELPAVEFEGISGPQLCAPAVTYEVQPDGTELWTMYIQTACFEEDGVIAVATSTNGQHFSGLPQPVITKESIGASPAPVVGVYDVGISEVRSSDQDLLCMVYSGYRRIGCGDIYVSYKNKHVQDAEWSKGECLLTQESLPFHNRPDYAHFEWGLEGAKIIQLAEECFVMIGVCFLPKPHQFLGSRQRVFLAGARSMNGPYTPLGLPFFPTSANTTHAKNVIGENGHPDTLITGETLWVIYQERTGNGQPWHLRISSFDIPKLTKFVHGKLDQQIQPISQTNLGQIDVDQYHLHYATIK